MNVIRIVLHTFTAQWEESFRRYIPEIDDGGLKEEGGRERGRRGRQGGEGGRRRRKREKDQIHSTK